MIRPDVLPDEFAFPYQQFNTYDGAAGGLGAEGEEAYHGTNDLGPQGETFESSNFVTVDSVLAFMETGLLPEHVTAVSILGRSLDELEDSGVLDFPDWQRSDVIVEMGS
jgi:hypothetical protein